MISCCLILHSECKHPVVKENLRDLVTLDSLITNQENLRKQKLDRINILKRQLHGASDIKEKLSLVTSLLHEYKLFDSDSAITYASKLYDLAVKTRPVDDSLLSVALINNAYLQSIQGYHAKSQQLLSKVPKSSLSNPELRKQYYKVKEYGCAMELVYATGNKEKVAEIGYQLKQYRDSLKMSCINIANHYPWLDIADKIENGRINEITPEDVRRLSETVDTISDITRINAENCYWLSRYYSEKNDPGKAMHYMILSSQSSIINQSREMASLPDLATLLLDYGDIDRAFNYIIYSSDQINAYKNRNRMVMLSSIISDVRNAYQERLVQKEQRARVYLFIILSVTIVLIIGSVLIINRNKKLSATRKQLSSVNEKLLNALKQRNEAITDLQNVNSQLLELNKVKREVIALAFNNTSQQIKRLDLFRKKLLKKFKLKQYDDIDSELSSEDIIKEQYADFYKAFDKMALSIYPDLPEEYNSRCNSAASVDCKYVKRTGSLNMRLRIYALRKFGIEKSADLAHLLNVSIRTVYNNRLADPNTTET